MEIIEEKIKEDIDKVHKHLHKLDEVNREFRDEREISFFEGYLTALNEVYCGLYCTKTEKRDV